MLSLRVSAIVVLLLATACSAADEPNPGAGLAKDIPGNREVQLLSAFIGETRGQNLIATFQAMGDRKAKQIKIRFPAHGFTPHEITLMNIIRSTVDWSEPKDPHKPHQATSAVIFSIPKDAERREYDFEDWWLVSIKPKKPE